MYSKKALSPVSRLLGLLTFMFTVSTPHGCCNKMTTNLPVQNSTNLFVTVGQNFEIDRWMER